MGHRKFVLSPTAGVDEAPIHGIRHQINPIGLTQLLRRQNGGQLRKRSAQWFIPSRPPQTPVAPSHPRSRPLPNPRGWTSVAFAGPRAEILRDLNFVEEQDAAARRAISAQQEAGEAAAATEGAPRVLPKLASLPSAWRSSEWSWVAQGWLRSRPRCSRRGFRRLPP